MGYSRWTAERWESSLLKQKSCVYGTICTDLWLNLSEISSLELSFGDFVDFKKAYIFNLPFPCLEWELQVCRMTGVFQPAEVLSVFTRTPFYVKRSVKSNRMQLSVRLPDYSLDKPPSASRFLFEHPLLTVINVHINPRRGGQREHALLQSTAHSCPPPKNSQTACIIAHQLTVQPFIVPGKTHPSMCTHTLTQTG